MFSTKLKKYVFGFPHQRFGLQLFSTLITSLDMPGLMSFIYLFYVYLKAAELDPFVVQNRPPDLNLKQISLQLMHIAFTRKYM